MIGRYYCCQSGDKNYKRLTCTQSVGLKHANFVISVDKVHKVSCHVKPYFDCELIVRAMKLRKIYHISSYNIV